MSSFQESRLIHTIHTHRMFPTSWSRIKHSLQFTAMFAFGVLEETSKPKTNNRVNCL